VTILLAVMFVASLTTALVSANKAAVDVRPIAPTSAPEYRSSDYGSLYYGSSDSGSSDSGSSNSGPTGY